MKVLIAVDDSPWSQAAMDFVAQMRWPADTEMTVLSAAAPLTSAYAFQDFSEGVSFLTPDMVEQQRLYHEKVAKRCTLRLRELGHPVHSEAPVADPREAIVEFAKREDVALIVVGSHGRSGLKKLLLGSVSSFVVSHAPCSVLVVKLLERK